MKIFGIGFHKTGTTSLARALELLGFSVTGPNGVRDPDIANNAPLLVRQLVHQFDAFQDNPWPIFYRELYEMFPEGKFILTYRNPKKWIESQVRHFGKAETPMRQWIYGKGCPEGNEDIYLARYKKHNQDVADFFKKKNKKLLIMNLEENNGWQKLCPYLGVSQPTQPFPHANKADVREARLSRPD